MITDEQARAALEQMGSEWIGRPSDSLRRVLWWARQELERREQRDDGPITAEWCRENGAEWCDRRKAWRWLVSTVDVLWTVDGGVELIGRWSLYGIETRRQLLALLAALRGEPSGNSGRPPHVSSAQMNNIGPSR